MAKNLSTAYLNQKKAHKVQALEKDHALFQNISRAIMKQNNFGQPQLILSEMSEIDLAAKFWKEMKEHAERFIQENTREV